MLVLVSLRLVSRMVVIVRAVLAGMSMLVDLLLAVVPMRVLMLVNMLVFVRVNYLPVFMRM